MSNGIFNRIHQFFIFFMNIFVSGLNYSLTSDELQAIFTQYGEVASAKVITDRDTGRSRGFGFVEMPSDEEAQKAIDELNGATVQGRAIVVNKSEPKPEGERRSFNSSRGGDSRGGYGGGNSRGGDNRGGGNRGGY